MITIKLTLNIAIMIMAGKVPPTCAPGLMIKPVDAPAFAAAAASYDPAARALMVWPVSDERVMCSGFEKGEQS